MKPSSTLALQLEVIADRLALDERAEREGHRSADSLAQVLLSRHRELGDRACNDLVAEVCESWPSCLVALEKASASFLSVHDGEIRLQGQPELRQARSLFDEDVLLAARVAELDAGEGPECRPIDAWKLASVPLPLAIPEDLAEILERPLAETHLHFGGTAPPITFWLPLMLSLLSVEKAALMVATGSREEGLETRPDQQVFTLWIRRLVEAALLRCWMAAVLPRAAWTGDSSHPFRRVKGLAEAKIPCTIPEADRPLEDWIAAFRQVFDRIGHSRPEEESRGPALRDCPVWVDPGGRFPYRDFLTQAVELQMGVANPLEAPGLGERYLLASGLRLLRGMDETEASPECLEFRRRLLRYIRIKHSFFRLLVHTAGIHGLDRFRLRFRRKNARQRFDRSFRAREIWELAGVRAQTRLTVLRWLDASTRFPLLKTERIEDTDLRRAEKPLREGVSRLERRLELRISPGEGRYHGRFIRAMAEGVHEALETLQEPGVSGVLPALQVGLVLHLQKSEKRTPEDYAETVGQVVGWLQEHPAWRPLLVGLDVAGSELDSPPSRFALAYRRLQTELEKGADRDRRVPISLGKTFHVGEDFRDLLTGIRQVDFAVDLLALGAGDRLGHALAIGHDPAGWYRRQGASFPWLGDHLVDLLWARELLIREPGPNGGGRMLATVNKRLADLGVTRIEPAAGRLSGWLDGFWNETEAQKVDEWELLDELVREAMPDGKKPSKSLTRVHADDSWIELLGGLQDRVVRRLDREGISVEANPTSNLLIGGLQSFSELPLFRLHPIKSPAAGESPALRLSISTDDPEIFRVHLREEYSALLLAGLESGHGRRDLLGWLDRLRQDGFDVSFLKRSAPRGQELASYLKSLLEPL